MIKRYEVAIERERLYCDDCDVEMKQDYSQKTAHGDIYYYSCKSCNKKVTSDKKYPRLVYIDTNLVV